jgi:hypothetical protein
MTKLMSLLGIIILFWSSAVSGATVTTHYIYVAAHGASRHDVTLSPWIGDDWTDGSGITSASYVDHLLPDNQRLWGYSDVSFQFNLAALAGSKVNAARINFKISLAWAPDNNNAIPVATLNYYGGASPPTGNAQNDKLIGTTFLQSFTRADVGKSYEIDVTSLLQADIAKGHRWMVFSLNHVDTDGTGLESPVIGPEGFADLLIVETIPSFKAFPGVMLLLM